MQLDDFVARVHPRRTSALLAKNLTKKSDPHPLRNPTPGQLLLPDCSGRYSFSRAALFCYVAVFPACHPVTCCLDRLREWGKDDV